VGPDRVGPYGAFMSVVHGLKVLSKEDFTPLGVDVRSSPWRRSSFFASIPLTLLVSRSRPGSMARTSTRPALLLRDRRDERGGTDDGRLGQLQQVTALLGALRAAAQAISYELPLTLSVVGDHHPGRTMSLNSIVHQQAGSLLRLEHLEAAPRLHHLLHRRDRRGEPDAAGHDRGGLGDRGRLRTEYSGMRFGFFFFAEYVNVFVVSALSAVLFFGGWNAPFNWPFP